MKLFLLRPPMLATLLLVVLAYPGIQLCRGADDVDFARDIRPILVNRCYRCHSSLKQDSSLRLDSAAAIEKGGEGGAIVAPGRSGDSRLLQAVERKGDLQMPPEGAPLKPAEVELIRRWIDAGAKVPRGDEARHWSFVAPQRHTPPATAQPDWPLTPVDSWIAARLDAAGLAPADRAPKHVFLRRLTLDLVGLPPADEDLRSYLADVSPDATERVIDRLLAQPAHGERWGRHWMDVWRYSDWDGYGAEVRESQPHIWRWRDWIIESINGDKPYNQMIVEMLAGDELAPQDPATLRATGFLVRNWFKFNRNVWLDNTIEHTGKAFVGLTFNCARCHNHMYDPMTQSEYYQLRAIFEPYDVRTDPLPGQADVGKDGLVRAYDAKLDTPTFVFTRGDEKQPEKDQPMVAGLPRGLAPLELRIEPITLAPAAYYPGLQPHVHAAALADATAELKKAETAAADAAAKLAAARTSLAQFLAARERMPPADGTNAVSANPPSDSPPPGNDELLRDDFAQARPDLWTFRTGKWEYRDGRLLQLEPLTGMCSAIAAPQLPRDFQATLRFRTTGGKLYKSVGIGFDLTSEKDLQFVYVSAYGAGPKLQYGSRKNGRDDYPPSAARSLAVELNRTYELQVTVRDQLLNVALDGQQRLAVRLAGERPTGGKFALWAFDATAEFLSVQVRRIPADFKFTEPATPADIAAPPPAPTTTATHQAAVDAAEATLADSQAALQVAQAAVAAVTARSAADQAQYQAPPAANAKELAMAASLAERQLAAQRAARALLQAEQKLAAARAQLKPDDEKSKKAVADAEAQVATQRKARDTAAAAAQQPGETYTRFGPTYATSSTGRRLALARWIAADDNPLAPRVAVNHLWLRHFGSPLVASVFDFGVNGQPATHPELLDTLARELVDYGWEMKRLHRLVVTSAVYRQASTRPVGAASADTAARIDPENRLLGRMNVRRMEAELVRDATLFVSDELDRRLYGPDLDPALGLTLPRRSLYFRNSKEKKMTFLSLFDGANVSECYRRSESIAPQQALALANSALSLAQARLLAGRLAAQTPATASPTAFVDAAFARVLGRSATSDERAACEQFLTDQAARLRQSQSLTPFGGPSDIAVKPSTDPQQRARENLIHVLLNHNDFVAIR